MLHAPWKWFERKFKLGLPNEMLPMIVERLRGTPARLEERLHDVSHRRLIAKPGGEWSVQEHAGHLLDLEELWNGRILDFRLGTAALRPADLQNSKTHNANHNEHELKRILLDFRTARAHLVHSIEQCDDELLNRSALHPRLRQPMRIVDHAFFVAEHDDHHLAVISHLLHRHD